jgi:hypothetical protein
LVALLHPGPRGRLAVDGRVSRCPMDAKSVACGPAIRDDRDHAGTLFLCFGIVVGSS